MIVGTVREIKRHEYRVGMTPECVAAYVAHGHRVLVQSSAGEAAGFSDDLYQAAGAEVLASAGDVFSRAEMIIKVKEPQREECELLRSGQILFTYLHLAADRDFTCTLMALGVTGVAYETIEAEDGHLPCLQPMSQIAGRLAVQEGAKYLEKAFGGRGILLGGVPGVVRGRVAILGGGVVGLNACKIAVGLGAEVTVLDINAERLAYFDDIFAGRVTTLYSTRANIDRVVRECDLLIGAVLLHGARTPRLVTREHLKAMKAGAVIVDVSIDQGGCIETSRPTTHDEPTFVVDEVVHYCVANMPGSVALTSTRALTSTTLSYGLKLADLGVPDAFRACPPLARGLNIYRGACVYEKVARSHNLPFTPLEQIPA